MKNIVKLLTLAAVALIGLNACNQDSERAFYDESAPAAYSFVQSGRVSELVESDNGVIKVSVARTDASTDGAVGLKLTASTATESVINALFSAPAQVTFAAGEFEATADIRFTLDDLEFGEQYKFSVEFANASEPVSPGGVKKTDVTASRKLTWLPIGAGTWTDGLISAVFNAPALTYDVQVEAAEGADGLYRMVNPYGFGVYEYTAEEEVTKNPCYVEIDARDPARVAISKQSIGIDWGYGEMTVESTAYASRSGKIITFAARQLGLTLPDAGGYYAGACRLVVP
ncbi:MAG: hypothetical protein LBI89_03405 [Prevotellaceae bacterium]|jgi:hypothetical protein|nr:hypothetical protein [Prevotellaceae bacterium]